jgi:cation/acetate symporter
VLVVALVAAWVAALRIADILQFVAAAFSLAASALFPVLVMGVFWPRASRAGATLAMLSGLGVCAWYMATNMPVLRQLFAVTQPLSQTRWWDIDPIAAGVFGVPVGFAVLVLVSLLTRPRQDAALVRQLRSPAGAA